MTPSPSLLAMEEEHAHYGAEPTFALHREDFEQLLDDVLTEHASYNQHLDSFSREQLLEQARQAKRVAFGTWEAKVGCPLQQVGICADASDLDDATQNFIWIFDDRMREQFGLDSNASGVVTIL